jgi:DNA-binding response OmpR family regulator
MGDAPAVDYMDVAETRLLMVDDDVKLCRLVREYLEPLGFEVSAAHTGLEGLDRALREPFQAVILDLMMPGLDGYEVLRRLRAKSNVPVLMLTGRGEEADRIVGLEMGADDYLPKTFSTRELLARLRAVLRRVAAPVAPEDQAAPHRAPIVVGELWVDAEARLARMDSRPVALTRIEFDLLAALARGCGRVQTREQLLEAAGGDREFEVFDRSIDVHIAALRRKLGEESRAVRYIETVRGVGYVMRWPDRT